MEFPPQAQTSASNINLCGVELISEIRVGSIEIQADKGAVEGETDSYVIPSLGESIHFTAVTDTADIPGLIRWSVSDEYVSNTDAGNHTGESSRAAITQDGGITAVCHVTVSEARAGLVKLIAQAETFDENDYLAEGFKTLQNVLQDARKVLADKYSRKQDWLTAADALQSAVNGLVNCEEVSAQLKELVNKAAAVDFTKYTQESYAPVQTALTNARAVLEAGKNASEEEILDAGIKLKEALDGLREKTPDDGNSGSQTGDTDGRKSPKTGDNSPEIQPDSILWMAGALAFVSAVAAKQQGGRRIGKHRTAVTKRPVGGDTAAFKAAVVKTIVVITIVVITVFGVMILACTGLFGSLNEKSRVPGALTGDSVLATIDGEPVTYGEFCLFFPRARAQIVSILRRTNRICCSSPQDERLKYIQVCTDLCLIEYNILN